MRSECKSPGPEIQRCRAVRRGHYFDMTVWELSFGPRELQVTQHPYPRSTQRDRGRSEVDPTASGLGEIDIRATNDAESRCRHVPSTSEAKSRGRDAKRRPERAGRIALDRCRNIAEGAYPWRLNTVQVGPRIEGGAPVASGGLDDERPALYRRSRGAQ